jgi:hypothetical protein
VGIRTEFDGTMTKREPDESLIEGEEWDAIVAAVCADADAEAALERLLAA